MDTPKRRGDDPLPRKQSSHHPGSLRVRADTRATRKGRLLQLAPRLATDHCQVDILRRMRRSSRDSLRQPQPSDLVLGFGWPYAVSQHFFFGIDEHVPEDGQPRKMPTRNIIPILCHLNFNPRTIASPRPKAPRYAIAVECRIETAEQSRPVVGPTPQGGGGGARARAVYWVGGGPEKTPQASAQTPVLFPVWLVEQVAGRATPTNINCRRLPPNFRLGQRPDRAS